MIQSIDFLNVDEGNLCPINVSLYIVLKHQIKCFGHWHRFVKRVNSFDTMILHFLCFFNIHFLFCFDSTLFLDRLLYIF